jgi:hypothetical protein
MDELLSAFELGEVYRQEGYKPYSDEDPDAPIEPFSGNIDLFSPPSENLRACI